MSDVAAERTCPRCQGTHVVKNGHRQGQQQYRCRSRGCEHQFIDRIESPGHRFPADAIATAIELRLLGRSYRKIAADVEGQFSISDTKISGRTVQKWVEDYISIAAEKARTLPVRAVGPWRVEYASLHPVEGGCWVVRDSVSSHVLAAQAGDSFDPDVAAELMQIFEASIGKLSDNLHLLIFATDEDFGDSEDSQDVPEVIKQQFPLGDYIQSKDFLVVSTLDSEVPSPDSIFEFPRDFWYPLQIMRKRKAFRSPESRQLFLDGWVVTLNFFAEHYYTEGCAEHEDTEGCAEHDDTEGCAEHDDTEGCAEHDDTEGWTTALGALGVGDEAPFRSWLDVVNYWGKVAAEGPRRE